MCAIATCPICSKGSDKEVATKIVVVAGWPCVLNIKMEFGEELSALLEQEFNETGAIPMADGSFSFGDDTFTIKDGRVSSEGTYGENQKVRVAVDIVVCVAICAVLVILLEFLARRREARR